MVDFKISDLPLANPMTGADLMEVVQGGVSKAAGVFAAFQQFGYGGQNPNNNAFNCNDLLAGSRGSWDGATEATAVSLNLPALGGSSSTLRSWHVECFGRGSARLVQEATEVFGQGTTRGRTFIRVKHDSTWYPWCEKYTTGNILGPVSQSDGVPTGAIIERGSNANGEFVKYADGTLICTHSFGFTHAGVDSIGGSLFRTGHQGPLAFPVAFVSAPQVFFTLENNGTVFTHWIGDCRATSADQYRVELIGTSTTTPSDLTVRMFAIRNWY